MERDDPTSPRAEPATTRLVLKPGRDRPLRQGHPWLYSGAVGREEGDGEPGLARVESAEGDLLGLGFYTPGARIRARLLGPGVDRVDEELFRSRLERAAELRRVAVPAETDGYRILNAEGDRVPGWTVDRFGPLIVSQITAAGLDRLRGVAYRALAGACPGPAILHQGASAARRAEGLDQRDVVIRGEIPETVLFRERGLRFRAELGGQKTGFYCDQRENRRRAEELAGGRRVLDLFAHSAAFSLFALRGGAARVVAVESAQRLLETARRQIEDNGLDGARAELVAADALSELRTREESFDLIVCDPPPFARRRSQVEAAARAYKDVNRLALARLAPGGFLFTFSCSGAVDARLFRQILFAAADEARVELQLLEPLGAAPDHPVSVFHPEGEYLKGWLARCAGRRSGR